MTNRSNKNVVASPFSAFLSVACALHNGSYKLLNSDLKLMHLRVGIKANYSFLFLLCSAKRLQVLLPVFLPRSVCHLERI